ncbi:MAG: hypothetical protein MI700_09055, partial [Balneolales bacterium]|nr:hypothetical protein [Balneolales bacterium]
MNHLRPLLKHKRGKDFLRIRRLQVRILSGVHIDLFKASNSGGFFCFSEPMAQADAWIYLELSIPILD